MAHGRPRDPRKAQLWRDFIRLWQRSGLSVRAFCQRHHLSQPNFYAWRRRLQPPQATPRFVAVQVIPDPSGLPAQRDQGRGNGLPADAPVSGGKPRCIVASLHSPLPARIARNARNDATAQQRQSGW